MSESRNVEFIPSKQVRVNGDLFEFSSEVDAKKFFELVSKPGSDIEKLAREYNAKQPKIEDEKKAKTQSEIKKIREKALSNQTSTKSKIKKK